MQVIKPNATLIKREDFNSPCAFIEFIGRTCYKSEDKIRQGSAEKFIHSLGKSHHYAMFEHLWVYFKVHKNFNVVPHFEGICNRMRHDTGINLSAFIHSFDMGDNEYVATDIRVVVELADYFESIKEHDFLVEAIAKEYPDFFKGSLEKAVSDRVEIFKDAEAFNKAVRNSNTLLLSKEEVDIICKESTTHTVRFYVDRGVTHEFVRHRVASFAQESTRYVKYGEIKVIEPCFLEEDSEPFKEWKAACLTSEKQYMKLRDMECSPQEARSVLPNSLASELVITANEIEWQHIINLRYKGTTGAPHPQIKQAMEFVVRDLYRESEGRLTYE